MKIAKLTWLHNGNYGSVLQALALQKFLRDNGFDVIDLNYNASISTKLLNWIANRNSPELFVSKFKEFKRKQNDKSIEKFELRGKRFEKFKNENLKLSKLCRSPKELKKISNDFDVFVCGSDQIWSPALMNPVFYFSFLSKEKTKISYAPSFGVINTTKRKKKHIASLLNEFKHISVRETQGQALVKELIGKDVPVQVDPTMLINRGEWEKYAGNEPVFNNSYIFCYLLTPNKTYLENVKKFALEKGLPVVIVPTSKGPFNTGFEEMPEAGPAEWLNLIKNASYVFTDSFHGCIFSAIFHKEFILYKRFSDVAKHSENSRVYTLTKLLNVEDRLIDSNTLDTIKNVELLDYEKIDKIIKNEADKSGNWLINVINESGKV